jgi:flagellar L-ring protein FlgH
MKVMRLNTNNVVSGVIVAILLSGCGVSHIGEYVAKRRQYKSPVSFDEKTTKPANGSLFNPRLSSAYLFADQRARRSGDIVTVRVREEADARREAATDLSRGSTTNVAANAFFSLLEAAGLPSALVDLKNSSDFSGQGRTSRMEKLEATVPAIVREVLPNGNLFIEGHRVVLVNQEEHHFYISGVVRPADIEGDNSVLSSLIADAEVEFTGRGVISEKQSPGWLQRGLDAVAPF